MAERVRTGELDTASSACSPTQLADDFTPPDPARCRTATTSGRGRCFRAQSAG